MTGDPDFLYAALDTAAYAAFFKESRMKCAGATKLHRKSGCLSWLFGVRRGRPGYARCLHVCGLMKLL